MHDWKLDYLQTISKENNASTTELSLRKTYDKEFNPERISCIEGGLTFGLSPLYSVLDNTHQTLVTGSLKHIKLELTKERR